MIKICRFATPIILASLLIGIVLYAAETTTRALASSNNDPNLNISLKSNHQATEIQAILFVNTLDDELNNDGDCSLREAIEAANTNTSIDACGAGEVLTDTITFNVAGIITVTNQLSVINGGPLVIDGGDAITTSGGGTTRVWWVDQGSNLNLRNLDVVNGRSGSLDDGAGLYNNRGSVIIDHCLFGDNTFGGSGNYGGGILNWFGDLTVWDSEFTGNGGNYSETYGGGIATWGGTAHILRTTFRQNKAQGLHYGQYEGYAGGGMSVFQSKVNIQDSSFIGNEGYYWGGGIAQQGQSILNISGTSFISNTTSTGGGGIYFGPSNFTVTGTMTITNSTFSGNEALYGAGIDLEQGSGLVNNSTISDNFSDYVGGLSASNGNLFIHNTIISNNLSGGDCAGAIIDIGHNLDSDGSCNLDPAIGSLPNTDPLLGPLQNNAGPTLTHALLPGSPAIDAGDDTQCPPTDQRGVPRPQDGNGDGLATCDIGAYELERNQLIVTTLEDELNNDGDCSLREAIEAANTNAPVDACGAGEVLTDTVTFEVTGIISLTDDLDVYPNGPVVIDGGDVITISGGYETRVWYAQIGSDVTLQHLAVINAVVNNYFGAALLNNNGSVRIIDSSFFNNTGNQGGTIANWGWMSVTGSTFGDNSAYQAGVFYNSNILNITDSSFIGNSAVFDGAIETDGLLTISGCNFSGNYSQSDAGVIMVNINGSAEISYSSFNNNGIGSGIGVLKNWGNTSIENSTFSNNSAGDGGVIFNSANLTITNSTFSDNSAAVGGSIENVGIITITNSTFSGNNADLLGGAINSFLGSVSISNSTFSGNTASAGGGISNSASLSIESSTFYENSASEGGTISGTAILTNTIIAGTLLGSDCAGDIIDGGHNLDSDGTCNLDPANGSQPNTDPLLGPLQDNGGPTLTNALLPGSPAIDAGDDAQCPPTDQRGVPRPQDGNGDGIAICDIGAFEKEFQFVDPQSVPISGQHEGFIDQEYSFVAMVEPISTTLPITYTWQASNQLPVVHIGGLTDTVSFTWEGIGTQTITVTASNSSGTVTNTHSITLFDVFIRGLSATNDGPTQLGETTTLSATLQEGTNVVYTWDFGDNQSGSGQVVTHTYQTTGTFTAVVTATNSSNFETATTGVEVIVPVRSIFMPMAIKSGGSVVGNEISALGDGLQRMTLTGGYKQLGNPFFYSKGGGNKLVRFVIKENMLGFA